MEAAEREREGKRGWGEEETRRWDFCFIFLSLFFCFSIVAVQMRGGEMYRV